MLHKSLTRPYRRLIKFLPRTSSYGIIFLILILLVACGDTPTPTPEAPAVPKPTAISTLQVTTAPATTTVPVLPAPKQISLVGGLKVTGNKPFTLAGTKAELTYTPDYDPIKRETIQLILNQELLNALSGNGSLESWRVSVTGERVTLPAGEKALQVSSIDPLAFGEVSVAGTFNISSNKQGNDLTYSLTGKNGKTIGIVVNELLLKSKADIRTLNGQRVLLNGEFVSVHRGEGSGKS